MQGNGLELEKGFKQNQVWACKWIHRRNLYGYMILIVKIKKMITYKFYRSR